VLVVQPLEDPLGRVALFLAAGLVVFRIWSMVPTQASSLGRRADFATG